ncbi:CHASE2 domain-containing protein [Herminiimonas sp. CN]|uniref:CHASE2 domain-containing protein n=1 Tax=Herminiimonas sp. CN TaxID=1349818 RepID=UPI000473E25D|nr:CHASE2 domain-containing protein [Herminiimonas sp. CN]
MAAHQCRPGAGWVDLAHHLIAATMLFAVLHFLEHKQMLEWLDAAMIRIAAVGGSPLPAQRDAAEAQRPSIIEIDRKAYESVFAEQAPLNRARLVELLDQIDRQRTGVLAIDIDLSPTVSERAAGVKRELDLALARLVRRGIRVVLALPSTAASAPGSNLAWVRARCVDGVAFADPTLHERLGVVSRVHIDTPTLALVARALAAAPGGEHGDVALAGRVCSLAAHQQDEQVFQDSVTGADEAGTHVVHPAAEPRPLNPIASDWRFLRTASHGMGLIKGAAAIEDSASLRHVVFIGGSYADTERFVTIGGPASGLAVHAASYISLALDTDDAPLWMVALLDLAIGVAIGFSFQWIWGKYAAYEKNLGAFQLCCAWWRKFTMLRFALLGIWLLPLLAAYIAMYASAQFFTSGMWLNPGPIIIGMFLHTLSLRHTHHSEEQNSAEKHDSVLHRLVSEHPASVFIQLPLTALLLVLASIH